MAISTKFVALLTTLQCPLQCGHCIYECSPHVTERMSLGQLKRYVDQIAAVGVPLINFSGGEPFLLGRDLDEIVGYTTGKGLEAHIVTAAHWATSKNSALERLKRLADRGLKFLVISCDDYHQEFVPFQNIRNAIEAVVQLGLHFHINSIFTSKSTITKSFLEKEFSELLEQNNYVQAKEWHQIVRNLAQQRGSEKFVQLARMLSLEERKKLEQLRTYEIHREPAVEGSGRCVLKEGESVPDFPIGHKTLNECNTLFALLVRPDGRVKGCVGHIHSQTEPDLDLGSLETEGLATILERAYTHPVLRCLEWGGPSVIAEYLMEQEPSLRLKARYRMSCDLCSDLFSNPAIRPLMYKHIDGLYERLKDNHRVSRFNFMIEDRAAAAASPPAM